jgi:hypothetical protein
MKKIIVLALLLIRLQSQGTIHHIPADYPTIQAGINASSPGDTVLVSPGTYRENITFMVKGIHLASLFLVTGDTSYISHTIIKANQSGCVVGFFNGTESNTMLTGFTITWAMSGGGIGCYYANPTVSDVILTVNTSYQGGGICLTNSNPILRNLTIKNNYAHEQGGGIFCDRSNPVMLNVTISNNTANDGAGMYCNYSAPVVTNLDVHGNTASNSGGGLALDHSDIILTSSRVTGNHAKLGGGIYQASSSPMFSTVVTRDNQAVNGGGFYLTGTGNPLFQLNSVSGNTATGAGGGFYFLGSNATFSPSLLNSVFSNRSPLGNDFRQGYEQPVVTVPLDTFTVLYPTDYYAEPLQGFNITPQHFLVSQVEADLFVDPSGSDTNSGLSGLAPLKTLNSALSRLRLDSTRRFTVRLADGIYSPAATGEAYPVNLPEYASLEGASRAGVILSRDTYGDIVQLWNNRYNRVSGLTLLEGGLFCMYSDPRLEGVDFIGTLSDTNVTFQGGGIYLSHSNPVLGNISISGFRASMGGGLYAEYSAPVISNLRITGCAADYGGAILSMQSDLVIRNALITGNSAVMTGGAMEHFGSTIDIACATFVKNRTGYTKEPINLDYSQLTLSGCILRDDSVPEIIFMYQNSPSTLTVRYSDIRGDSSCVTNPGYGTVNWLEGNISSDPLFADSLSPFPYSLGKESPCRDAAMPDTTGISLPAADLAGGPRIWNGRLDMGAYEWNNIDVPGIPWNYSTLEIYPNPARENCTIRYSITRPGFVEITLINQQGTIMDEPPKKWQELGAHEFRLHTGSLPAGVYLLQISSADRYRSKKLMVIH